MMADLRHAFRQHRATLLPSGFAVAVLAIAIAVLTTFLSLWSDLSFRGVAGFDQSRELVTVGQNDGRSLTTLTLPLIQRMDSEVESLQAITGTRSWAQTVLGEQDHRVETELVTSAYFSALRPAIEFGRPFEARDHEVAAEPVVILSHSYWQSRYGGDVAALGQTVRVRGPDTIVAGINPSNTVQAYRIVGVMARSVEGTFGTNTQIWMPYEPATAAFFASDPLQRYLQFPSLRAVGRLARSSTAEAVTTELGSRYGEAPAELGLVADRRLEAIEGLFVNVEARRSASRQVQLFLMSSALLVLVATLSISLFLLSRAPARRRELGVRLILGASMARLARQLATEAALLVCTAALMGLLLSLWLSSALRQLLFAGVIPAESPLSMDWRVCIIVVLVSFGLSLLVSLAPLLGLRDLKGASISKQHAARPGLVQRLVATVQISASGVLTSAALAFAWHLVALSTSDRGFDRDNVFVLTPQAAPRTGNPFEQNVDALILSRQNGRDAIESIPGVERVTFGSSVPGRAIPYLQFAFVGIPNSLIEPNESVAVAIDSADYAFTQVLNVPIVRGRALVESDRNEALANESLALAVWGTTDVIGNTLPIGPLALQIVGVVADVSYGHPSETVLPRVLSPRLGSQTDQILVEGNLTIDELRAGLDRLFNNGELGFQIGSASRLDELLARQLEPDRTRAVLTLFSAILVALLAGVGLYGTQRYLVSAAKQEFAVRLALGSDPTKLGLLVWQRGAIIATPGLIMTLPLGFLLVVELQSRFVSAIVSPLAIVLAVAVGIVALVGAASHGPASLARRTEIASLLREQ